MAKGSGVLHTIELKFVCFKGTMRLGNRQEWTKTLEAKHNKLQKYKIWVPVAEAKVLNDTKILTSIWSMKKDQQGPLCSFNARGYKQVDGLHYDNDNKSPLVVCNITVCIVLTMAVLAGWFFGWWMGRRA